MKNGLTQFILCCLLPIFINAQPIVDGDLSDAAYVTIATKLNANAGFGSATDVNSIRFYTDVVNEKLYLGVAGKLDVGTNNGIGVWLNFSGPNGASAGTPLGFDGAGHYMDGQGGGINDDFIADFEVDYMFALNPGANTTSVFLDAASLVGGTTPQYLGASDQIGGTVTETNVFGTGGSSTFAFNNGGGSNQGFEIVFDLIALGISPEMTMQAAAFVVSETGFFADVTVPGNASGGNLGFNPDFGATPGGPYHSGAEFLPVVLRYFTASSENNPRSVELDWATSQEVNSSHFLIERSADGKSFIPIGRRHAAANAERLLHYSFTDFDPLGGISYYRLRAVDFDEQYSYSNVRRVALATAAFTIFPNPVNRAFLRLATTSDQDFVIVLYDNSGRLISRQSYRGQNAELPISALAPGTYLLSIHDASGKVVQRDRFQKF